MANHRPWEFAHFNPRVGFSGAFDDLHHGQLLSGTLRRAGSICTQDIEGALSQVRTGVEQLAS